jgi:uncharacterized membrane protein YfcA
MTWEQLLVFLAAGFVMGVLSGTFGVGGGVIIVPALVLVFWMEQHLAQGMSLMAMVPIAMTGAAGYLYHHRGALDWRMAAVIGIAGIVGSLLGTRVAHLLPPITLRKVFAVFLVVVAVIMFFRDDLFRRHAAAAATKSAALPVDVDLVQVSHAHPSQ